jgi:hypothetical protein
VLTEKQIIKALDSSLGNQSKAAKLLKVGRSAITERIKKSITIRDALNDIREGVIDTAEDSLFRLTNDGHFQAIKFLLERKGKRRGWSEAELPEEENSDNYDLSKLSDPELEVFECLMKKVECNDAA